MNQLPAGFEDLEAFVEDWAIASRAKRFEKRVTTEFEKIQKFYHAILPRMGDAVRYLNTYPVEKVNDLSVEDTNLYRLTLSFMEVAACVECWGASDNYALEPHKIEILL